MQRFNYSQLTTQQIESLCQRAAIDFSSIAPTVQEILTNVKNKGDEAIINYCQKFDCSHQTQLHITKQEIAAARATASSELLASLELAFDNISKWHQHICPRDIAYSPAPGINCHLRNLPIEKVGLYIPGGNTPLLSTLLMLAIPAFIAGCHEIVVTTAPCKDGSINPAMLTALSLFPNVKALRIGGAQAIAALAYGSASVARVDKIFGPGNQYVTYAKMLAAQQTKVAIDMPAGPSEVMIIADKHANAQFVAADLLAQAEHSPDASAILVTNSIQIADAVDVAINSQLTNLPRRHIAEQALSTSYTLLVDNLTDACCFANLYAAEHLIINTVNAEKLSEQITNAASIFIGPLSSEAAGDYASGPNHTLPTSGYARNYSGLTVASFQKQVFYQNLQPQGVEYLASAVAYLAESENLVGHAQAIKIRRSSL